MRIFNWEIKKRSISEADGMWLYPRAGHAGIYVSNDVAQSVSAVFACVRTLSQSIASLPLFVYERTDEGKRKAVEHPLYPLLHDAPNSYSSSYDWRQSLSWNMLMCGTGFSFVERDKNGNVTSLRNVESRYVHVDDSGAEPKYIVKNGGKDKVYLSGEVLAIPWVAPNAIKSVKPIDIASNAIGLAAATEQFGSKFFSNGANIGGVFETDMPMPKDEQERRRTENAVNENYQGLSKANKVAILYNGMKFNKISTDPNDAQALETRKFQVREIARFYGIQPHMIQDLEDATFSNIEEQAIGYVQYSLRPLLVLMEQRMNLMLFTNEERRRYYVEFNVDGLLRGDSAARTAFYKAMFNMGTLSINEIRSLENMNIIEDEYANEHWLQLNQATAKSLASSDLINGDVDEQRCEHEHHIEQRNGVEFRQVSTASKRNALLRSRTAHSYEKRFKDAAQKMIAKEAKDLREASKIGDEVQLKKWISDYYNDPATIDRMFSAMQSSFQDMGGEINRLSAEEVDNEEDNAGTRRFINGYTNRAVQSHAAINAVKYNEVVTRAVADEVDFEEAFDIETQKMEETQADRFGFEHIVALSNAVAKMRFRDSGVTKLQWVTLGAKTCPYCQSYEGMIVGIEQNFANNGDSEFPDGADHSMKVNKNVSYAPLHTGCVCQIAPV